VSTHTGGFDFVLGFLNIVSDFEFRYSDLSAMQTELFQFQNFVGGYFADLVGFIVIPSARRAEAERRREVEESLDISWLTSI